MALITEAYTEQPKAAAENAPLQVAVLGAGSWGTALAVLLAHNRHSVRLWARDALLIDRLTAERENKQYLPDISLPEDVLPTSSLQDALTNASVVVFAVPCGAVRAVARQAAVFLSADANANSSEVLLISAAKGLEERTGLRMSQVLAEIVGSPERIVALSGPNLAVEIAQGMPSASVAASVNIAAAYAVQRLFSCQASPTFRVYTGQDVIGVELGGAIKNAIAIGAGVSDGLGYGDNSKAALMTRGLTEAMRLGTTLGADSATFLGLSGIGDLIATGASRLSRNYRVGFALGQGRTLGDILLELGQVAEGVPTTHVLCELAERAGVEMPLCFALRALLHENHPAPELIRALMLRPPKQED